MLNVEQRPAEWGREFQTEARAKAKHRALRVFVGSEFLLQGIYIPVQGD